MCRPAVVADSNNPEDWLMRVQRQEDFIAVPRTWSCEAGTRPIPISGGDHFIVKALINDTGQTKKNGKLAYEKTDPKTAGLRQLRLET